MFTLLRNFFCCCHASKLKPNVLHKQATVVARLNNNFSHDEWKTIVVEKVETHIEWVTNTRRYKTFYQIYYKNFSLPDELIHDALYSTPRSPLPQFVQEHYQYDIHLQLNSHLAHKLISIHTGKNPREVLLLQHLPTDIIGLIFGYICHNACKNGKL